SRPTGDSRRIVRADADDSRSPPASPGRSTLMPSTVDVFVANEQRDVAVDEHRLLSLVRLAASEEDVDPRAEVTVLLVDRASMAAPKEQWPGEPGPTDVLAGAETAFSRLTQIRALHLQEQGRRTAKYAVAITEDPPRYVNPILLAVLALHVTGTALAAGLAIRVLGNAGELVATVVMTTILFVFAEAAPKTSALQHTASW